MSAAPKRGAHEEGVHLPSSSMRPGFGGEEEENPGFPRVNYGAVQESRQGLLPRPESRDGERRSPLHSGYILPSSMTDTPHGSHPVVGPEIRTETRDSKDVREMKGLESNRDVKVETREVHHQAVKIEKESRVDDSKEVKYDREGRNDLKSELKAEKDIYGSAGSHSSSKEQHRVKKHSDVPSGGGGMSNFWMGPPHVRKYEAVKHATPAFLRKETDEAMGENRVDLKGDKERKRKEGKHHDWPESDKDRSDHKSIVPVGSSNSELKEVTREDKEPEQFARERKDVLKEKERPEGREKDHVDREGRSGGEKEGHQNEKEMADKTSVQENFGLEQKKPSESWRNIEREAKERRRERDGDLEGERPEKRSRGYDKESDEGGAGADLDVSMDRDRDAFNYSVQQRKRMLRPRGSPQVANRDGRFKSRGQDGEGYVLCSVLADALIM